MLAVIKEEKGFTLIEIMVVLVILGVLATISVPVYTGYVKKARVSEAIANIQAYATEIRIYRMEHGVWPPADTTLNVEIDDYYFGLAWAIDPSLDTLTITATPKDTSEIDTSKTATYTLDSEYKGSWDGTLVTEYASYLKRTT